MGVLCANDAYSFVYTPSDVIRGATRGGIGQWECCQARVGGTDVDAVRIVCTGRGGAMYRVLVCVLTRLCVAVCASAISVCVVVVFKKRTSLPSLVSFRSRHSIRASFWWFSKEDLAAHLWFIWEPLKTTEVSHRKYYSGSHRPQKAISVESENSSGQDSVASVVNQQQQVISDKPSAVKETDHSMEMTTTQFVIHEEEMCQRLIQVSFAKIVNSKNERGGARLHKNLLILHLLQKARSEQRR